jgi:phosphomannomutase
MNKFIFDVDGTLTPSRQSIDPKFKDFFTEFCINNDVYLVTGSDYAKTVEQLGSDLLRWPIFVYACSGNDVWANGERIRSREWTLPEEPRELLESWLGVSRFPLRTGNHFEDRMGTCNFSIVGRNATLGERNLYVAHDKQYYERETIALQFNMLYGDTISAKIGGETGIDIFPVGWDKSQIINDFDKEDRLYFFGDRMEVGGNDHPLKVVNIHGFNACVKDWQDTWKRLLYLQEAKIENSTPDR